MQVFVPYSDPQLCAKTLDQRRLGKQRSESLQLLQALQPGSISRWRHHLATAQWRGYEAALIAYTVEICFEWRQRGVVKHGTPFKDHVLGQILAMPWSADPIVWPSWWGREDVHYSHRCNLVRKLPAHYIPLYGQLDASQPYVWPVSKRSFS